jgi:hypothetical protein
MGRRTLLTPEVEAKIILAVRAGAPLKVAAGSAGIGEQTLNEWLQRGRGTLRKRAANAAYAAFAANVDQAANETHTRIVGTITVAAQKNWQAAHAWIKLRHPEYYAERVEVSGPGGGPIPTEIAVTLEGMTDAELTRIAGRLRGRSAPGGDRGGADEAEETPEV